MYRSKEVSLAVSAQQLAEMVDLSTTKLNLSRCNYVDDAFIEYISRLPQFARISVIDLRCTNVTQKSLEYILNGVFGTRRILPYMSKKYDNRFEAQVHVIVDDYMYYSEYANIAIPISTIKGVDCAGNLLLNIDYSRGVKYLYVTLTPY